MVGVWINASPSIVSLSAVPKPAASLADTNSMNHRFVSNTACLHNVSSSKESVVSASCRFYRKLRTAGCACETVFYGRSEGKWSDYVQGYIRSINIRPSCSTRSAHFHQISACTLESSDEGKTSAQKEQQSQFQIQVQRFYLPGLHCSIPVKCHRHYDSIRASVFSWFADWAQPTINQEWDWLQQSDMPGLVCQILPFSPRLDRMVALGKLCLWISCIDDIFDDPNLQGADSNGFGRSKDCIVNAIDGNLPEGGLFPAYILPLSSLVRAMGSDMSPRLHKRLVDGLKDFLFSSHAQVTGRHEGSLSDITEYVSKRRKTFAFEYIQVIMEYGMGIELDDETLEMKTFKELQQAAADFIAWTNDLLSFRKEYYTGDFNNLLPIVFLNRGGTNFQDAVQEVCDMIERREEDFHRILNKLLVSDMAAWKEELRIYLEHLPYLLSGHLEWYYTSARFHGLDHSVGDSRHGYVQMQPHKTIIVLPPPP